jgi:hypothetical protein
MNLHFWTISLSALHCCTQMYLVWNCLELNCHCNPIYHAQNSTVTTQSKYRTEIKSSNHAWTLLNWISFFYKSHCHCHYQSTPGTGLKLKSSQVKVTLRLTVSQSVSLGVEPHLGLMTRYLLLFDNYSLVSVVRSLWREDGSVFYICCWSSPA